MENFSKAVLVLLTALLIGACSDAPDDSPHLSVHQAFFANMMEFCGETFVGESTYPVDPPHDELGDVELTATIASCEENEIRVPLKAGEDESRTWIFTLHDGLLHLRHDHRYPDGTQHDLTDYGGFANTLGTTTQQYFEADERTTEMLPEAETNVWMVELDMDNETIVYYLERHEEPRFRAILAKE